MVLWFRSMIELSSGVKGGEYESFGRIEARNFRMSREISSFAPSGNDTRIFDFDIKFPVAMSGGKRGFKVDKFDGMPICFKTSLQMEGERCCDGFLYRGGVFPGHTNRERADWIKAFEYLISQCKKDLENLMCRLKHLEDLLRSIEKVGKVPDVPALPCKARAVNALDTKLTPAEDSSHA